MAKALIFSDIHIHSHKDRVDRLQHCLDVLNWIFRLAEERNVEYIWFLGDLFHERAKIDVMNYLRTFECFMKHMIEDAPNRDVYLLVGNHDMYYKERWDINSVKPLTAIPRVHIIDKPVQIIMGGRKVDWMPHTDNPPKELDLLKVTNGGAGDILLGHCAVHGALLNIMYGTKADVIVEYDNDMIAVNSHAFADWPMTILGHYHGAQKLPNNVEYIGSPLQLTYGEAFQQKHVIVLDLDTMEKEYIVNDFSPKHLIITPKDISDRNYDLNGNFVRLAVENLGNKEQVDIKREIEEEYKILSFDVKPKESKDESIDQALIQDVKAFLMNTQKMLETYVDSKGVPEGMERDKLFKIAQKCLSNT